MARDSLRTPDAASRQSSNQELQQVQQEPEDQQLQEEPEEGEEEIDPRAQLLPYTTIVTHCIFKNDPIRLIKCFEDETDPFKDEVQDLLNVRDVDGKSPLDLAACLGRVELTKELLKRGADVTAFTAKGYTSLHYAAAWGRLTVLKILVENGGDVEKQNIHGERPREVSVRYEQNECVDFLDWAEAKNRLKEEIRKTLESFQEADKAAAGRLSKEEKNLVINTCKEKQEWLDNAAEPTTEEFIAHYTSLSEIVTPIIHRLSEPLPVIPHQHTPHRSITLVPPQPTPHHKSSTLVHPPTTPHKSITSHE